VHVPALQESAVVTWTKQIKNVLKADPDIFLKDPHSYPGPLTELNFWAERAANLNSVHDQLMGEKIQKVVKVLELAVSTYYPAFKRCVHALACPADQRLLFCFKMVLELAVSTCYPAFKRCVRALLSSHTTLHSKGVCPVLNVGVGHARACKREERATACNAVAVICT